MGVTPPEKTHMGSRKTRKPPNAEVETQNLSATSPREPGGLEHQRTSAPAHQRVLNDELHLLREHPRKITTIIREGKHWPAMLA